MTTLEQRIERIEHRIEITELIARYCFTLDLRDIDALMGCFTEDAEFRRSDGTFESGRDKLRQYYIDNLKIMGPTLHSPQGNLIIEIDGPHTASSRHYGLAEHAVNDELVVAAMTYHHSYRRVDGSWLISRRVVDFWYFAAAHDLIDHYGTRQDHWWRGTPGPQWPFAAETYKNFVATYATP
jgi:hypothetical protein